MLESEVVDVFFLFKYAIDKCVLTSGHCHTISQQINGGCWHQRVYPIPCPQLTAHSPQLWCRWPSNNHLRAEWYNGRFYTPTSYRTSDQPVSQIIGRFFSDGKKNKWGPRTRGTMIVVRPLISCTCKRISPQIDEGWWHKRVYPIPCP